MDGNVIVWMGLCDSMDGTEYGSDYYGWQDGTM